MPHFAHHSEENYLKTLYSLGRKEVKKVNNVALAKALELNPATVLEMVRKLAARSLVSVSSDKTISLTEKGKRKALLTIRKHRLWEVFLVDKLNYKWNEVHDLAEQLEHVESADLTDRLEKFLGNPVADPHGDPIPDKQGRIKAMNTMLLSEGKAGSSYRVVSFGETGDSFLEYLESLQISPGVKIKIVRQEAYDQTWSLLIMKKQVQLSDKVAGNIFVQPA